MKLFKKLLYITDLFRVTKEEASRGEVVDRKLTRQDGRALERSRVCVRAALE